LTKDDHNHYIKGNKPDSTHFRNNKRKYLKDKINELAKNSKSKFIRDLYGGINEISGGYQPRSNLVKDENCDLLTTF
jgi:hypothetical protein